MGKTAKQDALEAIAATMDLERLRESNSFESAVKNLRRYRDDHEWFSHVFETFKLGDGKWLQRVIKVWNGAAPLPLPEAHSQKVDREGTCRLWSNIPNAGIGEPYLHQSYMLKGSPRLSWERTVHRDALGEEWLTLRVRITPDLTQKRIAALAKNSLAAALKAEMYTKPSLRPVAFGILSTMPQQWTIYRLAQRLQKQFEQQGLTLSSSAAKAHVRAWRNKQACKA
jgi:hypothetical protein